MPVYTVHAPPADRAGNSAPEDYVFVRDGFHVWAMIFGPAWMLFRKLWLVVFLYVVAMIALGVALWVLKAANAAGIWPMVLVSILIGLEAGSLRRWTLTRRGFRNVGVVVGETVEVAERRFFDRLAQAPAPVAPAKMAAPPMTPLRPTASQGVIGLFPEPGAPR